MSHLAKANQDRIGDLRDKQWSDLDGRIDAFRKDWRAKFGIDFKLGDKQSVVFADDSFPIRPGNEASQNSTGTAGGGPAGAIPSGNPATMSSAQPSTIPSTMPGTMPTVAMDQNPTGSGASLAGNTTQPASGAMPDAGAGGPSAFPNIPPAGGSGVGNGMGADPSQKEAMLVKSGTVELPQTPTAAVATIQLANEGQVVPLWHIRLPADVDAQHLHDALLARLTKIDDNSASWPTEINQAYQAVAREVLAALIDAGGTAQQ